MSVDANILSLLLRAKSQQQRQQQFQQLQQQRFIEQRQANMQAFFQAAAQGGELPIADLGIQHGIQDPEILKRGNALQKNALLQKRQGEERDFVSKQIQTKGGDPGGLANLIAQGGDASLGVQQLQATVPPEQRADALNRLGVQSQIAQSQTASDAAQRRTITAEGTEAQLERARRKGEELPEVAVRRKEAQILLDIQEGKRPSVADRRFLDERARLDPLAALTRGLIGDSGGLQATQQLSEATQSDLDKVRDDFFKQFRRAPSLEEIEAALARIGKVRPTKRGG